MREVSAGEIESLLATGIGDPRRLKYIIKTIKEGGTPADEDNQYLASLLKVDASASTSDSSSVHEPGSEPDSEDPLIDANVSAASVSNIVAVVVNHARLFSQQQHKGYPS